MELEQILNESKYSCWVSKPEVIKYIIGIKPFRASPNRVKTAADLLPVLKTFVAPGFLEPCFLGSGSLNITELITANGIDPAMYNIVIITFKTKIF